MLKVVYVCLQVAWLLGLAVLELRLWHNSVAALRKEERVLLETQLAIRRFRHETLSYPCKQELRKLQEPQEVVHEIRVVKLRAILSLAWHLCETLKHERVKALKLEIQIMLEIVDVVFCEA